MVGLRIQWPPEKSGALYRVGVLLSGNLLSQGLGLLSTPFIVSIYSPEHFGLLGVYISLLGIITPITMLRYEAAIPGAQDEKAAVSLFILCLSLASIVALLVSGILLTLRIIGAFPLVSQSIIFWLLPLGVLLTALYGVASSCAIRRAAFPQLARTKVSQGGWMVVSQLLLGHAGWKPSGLLFGHLVGQSGGSAFLLLRLWQGDKTIFHGIQRSDLKKVALSCINFPRLSVPAAVLEAFTASLPILSMAYFYSPTIAGWVTLLQRTIWIPMAMIAANISMVNFADFAAIYRKDPAKGLSLLMRRSKLLLLTGLGLSLIIVILAPWGIRRFFAGEWTSSIICLYIILPQAIANFVVSPFGCVLDSFRRQDLHFQRELARAGLMLLSLAAGVMSHYPWYVTLGLMSGAGVMGYVVYFWQSRRALLQHSLTKNEHVI